MVKLDRTSKTHSVCVNVDFWQNWKHQFDIFAIWRWVGLHFVIIALRALLPAPHPSWCVVSKQEWHHSYISALLLIAGKSLQFVAALLFLSKVAQIFFCQFWEQGKHFKLHCIINLVRISDAIFILCIVNFDWLLSMYGWSNLTFTLL